jgi:hypothetical protein
MEELVRLYVAPVAVGLAIGSLVRYVEPRSRVVHWWPAAFRFDIIPMPGAPSAMIWTHALTLQNVGWRAASNVEIIHKQKPQYFQIQPAVHFTEVTNTTGEHIIQIESLARHEVITIQILVVAAAVPGLVGVRSADGPSKFVTTRQHFVIPRARQQLFAALLIVGFATTVYWGARFVARFIQLLLHG